MEYDLIRSRRRTLAIEIRNGRLLVRAPYFATKREIDRFLLAHQGWIEKHFARAQAKEAAKESAPKLTKEELAALAKEAHRVIPERVACWAPKVGVTYGRITIRKQRTRWGSCSSKGNLNFNCLLLLTPPEVLDSVVVHELCHRKEMNHSRRFYAEVLRVFPAYKEKHRWLKEHGPALLAKLPDM